MSIAMAMYFGQQRTDYERNETIRRELRYRKVEQLRNTAAGDIDLSDPVILD